MRKLKTIGVALIAVFALTAVAVSAAQAAPAEFSWASGTAKLERKSNGAQTFLLPTIGSFSCNEILFSSTVAGTGATSFTTTPGSLAYQDSTKGANKCPGSIATIQFNTNECQYIFHAGTSTGVGKSTGTVDIACPTGKSIQMNWPGFCLVKFGSQSNLGPVNYATVAGSPTSVSVEMKIANLAWSSTGLCGTNSGATASLSGTVTVAGARAAGTRTAVAVKP